MQREFVTSVYPSFTNEISANEIGANEIVDDISSNNNEDDIVPSDPDGGESGGDGDGGGAADDLDRSKVISEMGSANVPDMKSDIHVLTVIGQVEGHLVMPPQNKTTKYEHVIPQLVAVEESPDIKGLLVILNTVGGDVEAGLAIAEMMASMQKPVVSLVLGGGHSIGVPIAVAAKHSMIAPTATMTIHPIRMTGMVLGVQQSFDYLERMQDRVIGFITSHSRIKDEQVRKFMMNTGELARDIGTVLAGEDAVKCGLIDEVGGLGEALACLHRMVAESRQGHDKNDKNKDDKNNDKQGHCCRGKKHLCDKK